MTYHYVSLAIGRQPRYKDIQYIVLYTEDGRPIHEMSDEEAFWRFGRKQIADYWVEDGGIHCKLEGVTEC